MGRKMPQAWAYLLVALLLAATVFIITGRGLLVPKSDSGATPSATEERAKELEESNRRVERLDDQIAQLRKELAESSKQVVELQTRLEETAKALSVAERKLKNTMRAAERSAPAAVQPRARETPRPAEPIAPTVVRRPAEPGSYEVIRTTEVFEEPSESSRKVSTIRKGTTVTVVRSVGEWLEVRSKRGNPPGFLRRDDAMFLEKRE